MADGEDGGENRRGNGGRGGRGGAGGSGDRGGDDETIDRGEVGEGEDAGGAGDGGEGWLLGEGEPVELPITDALDLHSFRPGEVAAVVREYLDAAYAKGLRELRIIHGRGVGVQRRTVRVQLERDPRVVAFGDAPAEAGGWGATWVRLR